MADLRSDYLKHSASDNESLEISQIVREETRRHMKLNFNHIAEYIRDHVRSSLVGGGFKWRNAFEVRRDEWNLSLTS